MTKSPIVTAADLRAEITRDVGAVPREVLLALDHMSAVDAVVDVVTMRARSLADMIDTTYARSTEGLGRLADDVRALDGEQVRFCRVEADGVVLLVVLATTTPTVASTFLHSPTNQPSTIELAQLEQLLHRSSVPLRDVAAAAVRNLAPDAVLVLHRQDAARTARTFEQKYSAAIRNGFDVRGLQAFLSALRSRQGEAILLLHVPAANDELIVGVREDRSEILAVLQIGGRPA